MASNNPYTSFGQTTSADAGAPSGQPFGTSTFGNPSKPDAHPANLQAAMPSSEPPTGMAGTTTATQGHGSGATMANLKAGAADLGTKAKTVAGNVWGHLSTGHGTIHTAVGKLQNYRLLTPSSAQSFWRENFQPLAADIMKNYYACHLSTSTGPVAGTLFVATQSVAFMSDRPLSYNTGPTTTAWSYYKVTLPLNKVADVTVPSGDARYIQINMIDGHQFWFMGFISFDKALQELRMVKDSTSQFQGQQQTQGQGLIGQQAQSGGAYTQGVQGTQGTYGQGTQGAFPQGQGQG